MDKNKIIELIKSGQHDKALNNLYQNFPAFKKSFVKAGGKTKDAADLFQDALLILIENCNKQNFVLTCEMNTYLFSICRNLSLVYFKKKSKSLLSPIDDSMIHANDSRIEELMEREKKYHQLDEVLKKTGKKCLEILSLFYEQNLKMTVIAERLGYKSESSAKTQKYKCLEKAKSLSKSFLTEQN